MTTTALITVAEAQLLDVQVRMSEYQLRINLYRFYSVRAWEPLNYPSFQAYCEEALNMSYSQAMRYIKAGDVALADDTQTLTDIGIKHAEQLARLAPGDRLQAWNLALRLAGNDAPTVGDVSRAVKRLQSEQYVEANAPAVIVQQLHAGDLTATDAHGLAQAFDRLPPHGKSVAAQMLDRHGIRNPDVLQAVGELGARKNARESKVWQEIVAAGTVNGVPLSQATATDLDAARDAARREHVEEAVHEQLQRKGLVAIIVTICNALDDGESAQVAAARTAAVLRRELSDPVLNVLKEIL